MKKWKLFSVLTVLLITLTACMGANDDAQRGGDNPNIDPTTNRNTGNPGMTNDNRDYMFENDSDRNQERRDRDTGDNRANEGNESRYDIANEAADKITDEIDEIDNAYVLTTENNAYVAANLDIEQDNRTENRNRNDRSGNTHDLSDEIENRIGEIVRSVDDDIENVYVSTNPDFLDLATNYTNDMDEGRPIGGMFNQIGEMIDRLFPDNITR